MYLLYENRKRIPKLGWPFASLLQEISFFRLFLLSTIGFSFLDLSLLLSLKSSHTRRLKSMDNLAHEVNEKIKENHQSISIFFFLYQHRDFFYQFSPHAIQKRKEQAKSSSKNASHPRIQ